MSRIPLLYDLLSFPKVYSFSQKVLAPGSQIILQKRYELFFVESKGRVLDVGCGPSISTPIPNGIIVGCDINTRYVRNYRKSDKNQKIRKEYGEYYQCNPLGVVCRAERLPFKGRIFDEIRCCGLLHHLPKESAIRTIKEMLHCTRPLGKVIIFDNVWPKNPVCRPLAWLSRRYDRGRWVRTEDQLLNIVYTAYRGNWTHRRFTYSFTGLEGIILTIERELKCIDKLSINKDTTLPIGE